VQERRKKEEKKLKPLASDAAEFRWWFHLVSTMLFFSSLHHPFPRFKPLAPVPGLFSRLEEVAYSHQPRLEEEIDFRSLSRGG